MTTFRSAPPLLAIAIALLSASALAYEVLLMRIFSVIQWHHFAYMIISLALLGYGISGVFLTLFQTWLYRYFRAIFMMQFLLFGITLPGAVMIAQYIPFDPRQMLWDWHTFGWLLLYFLLFTLPFFFVANAIGLVLGYYRRHISLFYGADMVGAGLGSLGLLALLFRLYPTAILQVLSALVLIAAAVAWAALSHRKSGVGVLLTLAIVPFLIPQEKLHLHPSPYKALSKVLQIKDTQIVEERIGELGILTVVASPAIPFRYAPGLSINCAEEPPPQLAVFTNAEGMNVITKFDGNLSKLTYMHAQTSALAYALRRISKVLVLGAGGGAEILQALSHEASEVVGVELDRGMIDLVRQRFGTFAGHLYDRDDVRIVHSEARGFLAREGDRYDLIQIAMIDAYGASGAGMFSLSENYLYTVEAFRDALAHLNRDGYLSITRWLRLPPRDSLKLFATALEASGGREEGRRRIVMIRSWQTVTMLLKKEPFTHEEIENLNAFCRRYSFDLIYYPGIAREETNRFNLLERAYFYEGVKGLLTQSDYVERYKFYIAPATDDRPFFYRFFKWSTLPEIYSLRGSGGLYLMEWGYLVLIASLLLAVVIGVVSILLPLAHFARKRPATGSFTHWRITGYFWMLGMAFFFLEIVLIQRFILFLAHPVVSAAVVLSTFLVFTGLGSLFAGRLMEQMGARKALVAALLVIVLFGLIYLLGLGRIFAIFMAYPFILKLVITAGLIAPLAFAMGLPFPIGLSVLGRQTPALIPWAWAINGFASVLSAILATLLAIHLGFTVVALMALSGYLSVSLFFPSEEI